MRNLAAVYAADITRYALEPLGGGTSVFARVMEFAGALPAVEKVLLLCRPDFAETGTAEAVRSDSWTVANLVETLATEADGFDHVFFMYGDTPLLDTDKAGDMYSNHVRYFAQYSFADGYPVGLTVEIARAAALKEIALLAADMDTGVQRDSLFEAIKKDINAFDIETDIAANDQRLLRVTLAADTRRNTRLLEQVLASSPGSMQEVCDFLDQNAPLLRTLPAYVLIQIEEGCPQACSYCPWPQIGGDVLKNRGEMGVDDFDSILAKVSEFSGDATIGVSLWGEPSLHSRIADLADRVMAIEGLSLMIETSGIGWQPEQVDRIIENSGDRATWIVSLDAIDEETYIRLRGHGQKEAMKFAETMVERAPARVHIQAVRMDENEPTLQTFYRYWKQRTSNIIIQKHDHFCGVLPEKKVTDLSPLNRFPCWHLKRDVHILLDGSVPVCREDLAGSTILGNIFSDSLETIWRKGEAWYLDHIAGAYPELCKGCDEYYTYNF